MAKVKKFVKEEAHSYFDGALLATGLISDGEELPFVMDWAYVQPGASTGEEVHNVNKVFIFVSGTGTVVVAEEHVTVLPGLVVWIPCLVPHHLENQGGEPLQLAVVKWNSGTAGARSTVH